MGIKKWWNLDSGRGGESIQLGGRYYYSQSNNTQAQAQTHPKWQMFWKKIKRERKRFPISSHQVTLRTSYDPNTYSKNFDQGTGWMEPDNLSRSFSARFADPSNVLRINCLLD
ncbi:hypothetical protein SLA2020_398000 [Shorea laevis]